MKSLTREQSESVWQKFFDQAEQEAFKCEVLQDYFEEDRENPSLKAWLAGDREKSIQLMTPNKWHLEYKQRPIRKIRVHVVSKPFSAYLEWEIEAYRRVIIPIVGEQVLIVSQGKVKDLDLPDGDFWIFDDKKVIRYHYSNGRMCQADIYDELDDISHFLKLKKQLTRLGNLLS